MGLIAAACCAWLLWRLANNPDSEELRALEWVFPLRGRWLRYVFTVVLWLLLVVCLVSGLGTAVRPPAGTLHSSRDVSSPRQAA